MEPEYLGAARNLPSLLQEVANQSDSGAYGELVERVAHRVLDLRLESDGSASRAYRGGGFSGDKFSTRSANRNRNASTFRTADLGLRAARSLRRHR